MTALRPTNSPIRLPRALRAALLGFAFFSATAAATACTTCAAHPAAAKAAAPENPAQAAPEKSAKTATEQNAAPAAGSPQADAADTPPAAASAVALPSGKPAELGLSRWDYKEEAFFKRISEYFTGEENPGYRIILRTDPQQRDGLYFQAPLNIPVRDLPQGAALQVRFIRPDKADQTVTHTFAIPAQMQGSGKTQLWLGFTGADTPADNAAPVAWQIRVVDAEGRQLAETNSYLWSPRDSR